MSTFLGRPNKPALLLQWRTIGHWVPDHSRAEVMLAQESVDVGAGLRLAGACPHSRHGNHLLQRSHHTSEVDESMQPYSGTANELHQDGGIQIYLARNAVCLCWGADLKITGLVLCRKVL